MRSTTTGATPAKVEDQVMGEVKKAFNPEFLNRLDEVILFTSLEEDDLQLVEFWQHVRKDAPLILVATKLDKLPVSKQKPAIAELNKDAGTRVIGFSAETGEGRAMLWKQLFRVIGDS